MTDTQIVDRLYMTLGGLEADIREGNNSGNFVDGLRYCVNHIRSVLGAGSNDEACVSFY